MSHTICAYCSSSNRLDERYYDLAAEAGRLLAGSGQRLIYGGGSVGLMGALARSVHAHGGHVTGVIPERLKSVEGVAYDAADELIVTATMQERKRILFTRGDAFLVLPGGFGTLEEFIEVVTLRQLGYHHKPIVLVNAFEFFDPLLALFEHYYREGFARREHHGTFSVADTPAEALHQLAEATAGFPEDS